MNMVSKLRQCFGNGKSHEVVSWDATRNELVVTGGIAGVPRFWFLLGAN